MGLDVEIIKKYGILWEIKQSMCNMSSKGTCILNA